MPEFYYGTGEGPPSLATAKVMATPFFKNVVARKNYYKNIFSEQFDYVIWVAKQKGVISDNNDTTYTINVNEPDPDKAAGLADALDKFSKSIMTLQANALITDEEAKQVLNLITSQMGVEIDTHADETVNEKTMQAAHKFLTAYNKLSKKK